MEPDLFSSLAYPNVPGARHKPTSQNAAKVMAPRATSLKERALALLQDAALTADEIAAKLGADPLAIRPRCTEMAKETPPRIYDTGKTRHNPKSKLPAIVWRAITDPPR